MVKAPQVRLTWFYGILSCNVLSAPPTLLLKYPAFCPPRLDSATEEESARERERGRERERESRKAKGSNECRSASKYVYRMQSGR